MEKESLCTEKSVHDPTNCDHEPEWYAEYDEYYVYNRTQAQDEEQEQEAYNALLEMERKEIIQKESEQLVEYINFLTEIQHARNGNVINKQVDVMVANFQEKTKVDE